MKNICVTLIPCTALTVQLLGTDGEFEIHFDSEEYPKQLVIKETAGLRGSVLGDANSILYHERWGTFDPDVEDERCELDEEEDDVFDVQLDKPTKSSKKKVEEENEIGFFVDASNKVQCTALINCEVRFVGDERIVYTHNSAGDVSGEFTFFASIKEMQEAAPGIAFTRITI